ncbi:MAG: DUF4255 domain-containing protein [Synechococcus sp.]
MIADALSLLLTQLNQYIHQEDESPQGTADVAIMGNISQVDVNSIGADLQNHLVLSLVNLEEESTLKNGRTFSLRPNNNVNYHNVPLHVNLFLLWTANYQNYETALRRLSQVMIFFQGKSKFTLGNSPESDISPFVDFSLTMEFLSLSLEEINHLWGALGGKQLPFAAYRGRLITLQDRRLLDAGGLISEIEVAGRDATQ